VIMVTGNGESEVVVEAFELGANDFIPKPIDVPVAVARIRTQLARRDAECNLAESEERYALVIRAANDGIFDWRFDRGEGHFSPRWWALLGYESPLERPTLDAWFNRVHPDDLGPLRATLADHLEGRLPEFEFEHRVQGPGDSYRWVMARAVTVRNGADEAIRLTGSISDITEGKVADALTGLPNRVLLKDRLTRLLSHTRRTMGFQVVVMFIDLDRFKMVNDSLGHQAGDELLIQAAGRLDGCVRSSDTVVRLSGPPQSNAVPGSTVGRVGGDEFVVVLGGFNQGKGAQLVADRLHAAFAAPFEVRGQEVFVSLSVGVTISNPLTEHGEDLLREADTAMYRAKTAGSGRTEFFTVAMQTEAREQLRIDTELRRALERRDLDLHYQPILSLETGRTVTLEALLRWKEPQGMLSTTAEMVTMAERSGLITSLGYWVVERACADFVRWTTGPEAMTNIGLAINLSAKQLGEPALAADMAAIADKAGVPHDRIEFELTESSVMTDPPAAQRTLEDLRALGFRLSIDDFGTGQSSLSYVHRLPVNRLKFDRSFFAREKGARDTDAVIRTIVELGRRLGIAVVAEGVETEADLARVRSLGCELAQGYLFAKPGSADTIPSLVRACAVPDLDRARALA
jgi:predicted signal transduction protein with EAL and GGDEF domain